MALHFKSGVFVVVPSQYCHLSHLVSPWNDVWDAAADVGLTVC